jgi:hypothetical protein
LGPFLTREGDNVALGVEARDTQHRDFRFPAARHGAQFFGRMTAFHCDQAAFGRDQVPGVM